LFLKLTYQFYPLEIFHIIFPIVLTFGFIAIYALIGVYLERKIAAFIQDRVGPDEVGYKGTLQTFADILKLLQKEIVIPDSADKILFWIAPIVIFSSVFAGFAVLPFSNSNSYSRMNLALLWVMSIVSIDAIGILMAGWASNNKYSLLGSMRAISQMIAYEIPLGFSILSIAIIYGTLNIQQIIELQSKEGYLWGLWNLKDYGGFFLWSIVQHPHLILVFIIFFITGLAECNRAPFDLPEAESELIAGFHAEYGGFAFATIMLAEYANMLIVSLLSVIMFFGGWNSPFPNLGNFVLYEWTNGGLFWSSFWLFIKTLPLIFIMMWIRWTFPRFRADQLLKFSWKILLPFSILLTLISAFWKIILY